MTYSRLLIGALALVATALLVALGTMRLYDETAGHRPVVPPYDFFWCAKNEDCVVVDQIGCCNCRNGGGQAAITSWHRDDLEDFLEDACQPATDQVCVQVDACRRKPKAECVDRRCRIDDD